MSNSYLKVTDKKKWPTQNFNFLSLKKLSPGQFLGSSTYTDIIQFLNFFCNLKTRGIGSKTVCGFSINLILKILMTF